MNAPQHESQQIETRLLDPREQLMVLMRKKPGKARDYITCPARLEQLMRVDDLTETERVWLLERVLDRKNPRSGAAAWTDLFGLACTVLARTEDDLVRLAAMPTDGAFEAKLTLVCLALAHPAATERVASELIAEAVLFNSTQHAQILAKVASAGFFAGAAMMLLQRSGLTYTNTSLVSKRLSAGAAELADGVGPDPTARAVLLSLVPGWTSSVKELTATARAVAAAGA